VAACPSAGAQAGDWAWMGGSSPAVNQPAVYGTLGVPAAGNIPGARGAGVSWTDNSGNFWLFGGSGYNDLWQFNPSTNEWAWMGGSSAIFQPGVYGALGVPASGNLPGGRSADVSWTDSSGNFWLFGGYGSDANGTVGDLNDLWQFNPSTNLWAWMGGSSTVPCGSCGQPGVYGTLGTPASGNIPGGRIYAVTWTDSSGHLWLFGGASDIFGNFDDLWEFNPSTNEWAWMGGSAGPSFSGQPGVYGTLGVPAAGNIPGARYGAVSWTGSSGHIWLFGGFGDAGWLDDLWEFYPTTNEWAWMGGSGTSICNSEGFCGLPGVYGTLGASAAGNIPGSRFVAIGWTDNSGDLWLFGGSGFDANGTPGNLNDLWQFNPSTNLWAWMGGSSTVPNCGSPGNCGQPGVYGTLGVPAAGNIPGARGTAVGWTDIGGHLWLFGGGAYNDLWEYWPTSAKTTPVITWPAPAAITYGTELSATQLDATTTVAGTFTYSPAAGTVLGVGTQTLNVTFKPNDATDYSTAKASVTLVVNPLQAITFAPLTSPVVYGVPPIHLHATSVSGREVHFRVRSGPGFVHHDRLTITGAGTIVVAAYLERGPEVTQSIVVDKATPTIRLESRPHSIAQGQWITFKARLRGAGDTPHGKVTFFDGETRLGEGWVNWDGEAQFSTNSLSAGTNSITAVYRGDGNYVGVTSSPLDITVH